MKEALIKIFDVLGLAFWVEIITETPKCTYYFGPFVNQQEAQAAKYGYIEDLEDEGAQGIIVTLKRCKPTRLTIFDELPEQTELDDLSSLSKPIV
ncbi:MULTISPECIES: DUF1816 domain-containing protein [Moorena]|uniref:DUF1816 domain-containing protein n=1 Tax=Moorena producens 3L TaxID=489825 RepID=F4XL43_9CYAN|nr:MULTISPECIES: DUF1816 domain-containing protein [Moorena]NES86045.1 DUF1816 domain-containing protein [Moorena sp. SIO2B7]EGJ34733.1 protein of unknown function, DUF1816 [Moorena producens 3L]NEP68790.1 DUF1816 domain-containing protein [Moorena sp. SIO3A5]NEQ11071.1 DUF1816 domain-containing protein [Moorena sp. SIO4E2]NER86629.1 DUF1816 domain-containing protein [Moorena sp. SIO3A2]